MEIAVRATVIYWFLWVVVRGSGKRSLAQLTPLDLLLIVVLGDFVQQGVTQEDMSLTGAMLAVSIFVLWTFIGDYFSRRSKRVSRVLAGEPVIVVRGGRPLPDRLRSERVSIGDLNEAARAQGYRDLADIEVGILENDGYFSFIPVEGAEH